jgi:hypothetical protein
MVGGVDRFRGRWNFIERLEYPYIVEMFEK